MISVNAGATTYTFDALGSRVTKTTGTTTVRYYFALAEKTNGSRTKALAGTPAGVVEWDNGTVLFKSNDHLGSPRVITNTSGTVVGRTDLYPYGEIWSQTGTQTKYKLTGKERDDESGLDYFGVRYYDSTVAKWLSPDSVTHHAHDPQSLNKYAYARNDPVNLIDPDGREWLDPY